MTNFFTKYMNTNMKIDNLACHAELFTKYVIAIINKGELSNQAKFCTKYMNTKIEER